MSKELMNSIMPSVDEMKILEAIVKYGIDSKFLEKIGGFAAAMSIALYAHEMGLPIMTCLFGGVRSVLGRVELSPQMTNALIRKAGHLLETIDHDETKCIIRGKRKDSGEEMTVTFTIEDAKRANNYKGAWITYPRNMTYKSALSNLGKWLFPDVIGMAYVEGEISDAQPFDKDQHKKETLLVANTPQQKPMEIQRQEAATEPMISEDQSNLIEDLLKDEEPTYRQSVLDYFGKNLGKPTTSFVEIPDRCRESILRAISKRRLQREQANEKSNEDVGF